MAQDFCKPFKWLGNEHGKTLWIDVDGDRKIIGPGQIVKSKNLLEALGSDRIKALADSGQLEILNLIEGAIASEKNSTIDLEEGELDAARLAVSESVKTSDQLEKLATEAEKKDVAKQEAAIATRDAGGAK